MKSIWVAFLLLHTQVSGQSSMQPNIPRAGSAGIVREHPFTAKFMVSGAIDGKVGPWTSAIYRDVNGSVRTDMRLGSMKISSILDVLGQRLIMLQEAERTAIVVNYPIAVEHVMNGSNMTWGFNLMPSYTNERKQILKIDCRKVRLSDASGIARGEVWIAEELGVAMEDRQPGDGTDVVWQVTSVTEGPPREDLFRIPQDYKTASQ